MKLCHKDRRGLYKLNMDHGSFENVRYKDEDTRNKN